MQSLRLFLFVSTVLIYVMTIMAVNAEGFNWPVVYFGDLLNFDWRAQFNTDFLIHLLLLATWVAWREGFTMKGYIFGFLSIFMGGMFGFVYLLVATFKASGDARLLLLGIHSKSDK